MRLLLKGGKVVDPELSVVKQQDVLVENERIVRIGSDLPTAGCEVISCEGKVLTAGYVDAHVHIESSMVLPVAFGEAVLPQGTTTIIADPHEVVNVAGGRGLHFFMQEEEKSPIDIYTVIPSSVPATPLDTNGAGKFLADDMVEFLSDSRVVGLGEVMNFRDVETHHPEIMDKLALFRSRGLVIDGHTVGMPESYLDNYVAVGVQNDHECTTAEEMMSRYRRGMNIYIREGSAARNAKALLQGILDNHLDLSRFAFCTDDKHLSTIAEEGHISYIVAMARKLGFSWCEVAGMASYNACKFYRIPDRGNIREGYFADIVVTDEWGKKVDIVIKKGRLAALNGKYIKPDGEKRVMPCFENSVIFKHMTEDDFLLPEKAQKVGIALVEGQLLTERVDLKDGEWKELPVLATVERYGKNGNIALCPLKGYGIRNGAVATSVSHDSHNVICVGDNPSDMAAACNRVREIGGGYVIATGGHAEAEFPLPAFGLMSDKDAETAAADIAVMEKLAHQLGINPNIDPFITLSFAALPVIPFIRLMDTGLYDVADDKFIVKF